MLLTVPDFGHKICLAVRQATVRLDESAHIFLAACLAGSPCWRIMCRPHPASQHCTGTAAISSQQEMFHCPA